MINIFNELYTLLVTALNLYNDKIKTDSVYTNQPSSYPFVSLEEIEDAVYESTSDSCDIENHAEKHYEVNIYTQKPNKKSTADGIANVVDDVFKQKNFVRITKNVLQSNDETTYRIIIRYRGIVSKSEVVYRR